MFNKFMKNDKQKFAVLWDAVKTSLKSEELKDFGSWEGLYETKEIEITIEYSTCGTVLYKTTFDFNPEEDMETLEFFLGEEIEKNEGFKGVENRIKGIISFENRIAIMLNYGV